MTTIKQRFEAVFLDGKSSDNILVSSQLQLGADGEYFNHNTRAMYRYYLAGWEHCAAAAAAAAAAKPVACATGHLPIGWPGTGGTWCEICNAKLDDEVLPEDPPEDEAPATATSLSADPWCTACAGKGNQHGDLCPSCWTENPF